MGVRRFGATEKPALLCRCVSCCVGGVAASPLDMHPQEIMPSPRKGVTSPNADIRAASGTPRPSNRGCRPRASLQTHEVLGQPKMHISESGSSGDGAPGQSRAAPGDEGRCSGRLDRTTWQAPPTVSADNPTGTGPERPQPAETFTAIGFICHSVTAQGINQRGVRS